MVLKSTVKYVYSGLKNGKRFDGRKPDEYREIKIETGISKNAEGSAKVTLGKTEVMVGIKIDVGTPYPDSPDKGVMSTSAEFLPMASPDFESGRPGEVEVELGRVVDRAIREGNCIDFEKLCIEEGEKVFMVYVDILVTNHDGNLIDAAGIAAMAALKEAKLPKLDENNNIIYGEHSGKLPLKNTVLSITVRPLDDKLYVDCTEYEEASLETRLTVGVTKDGKITSLQKGGEDPFTKEQTIEMLEFAKKKALEIIKKHLK